MALFGTMCGLIRKFLCAVSIVFEPDHAESDHPAHRLARSFLAPLALIPSKRWICAQASGLFLVVLAVPAGGETALDGGSNLVELLSSRPAHFYDLVHSADESVCQELSTAINRAQAIEDPAEGNGKDLQRGGGEPTPLGSLAAYLLKHELWVEPWKNSWHETSPAGGSARWDAIQIDVGDDGRVETLFRSPGRVRDVDHHILYLSEQDIKPEELETRITYDRYLRLRGYDEAQGRDRNRIDIMKLRDPENSYRPPIASSLYFFSLSQINGQTFLLAATSYLPIKAGSELFLIRLRSTKKYEAVCHFTSPFRFVQEDLGDKKSAFTVQRVD